ncbi:NUDIX hydrolase [Nocardioides KLBMP 9356]|uniref:NUDIX hydrolase n=1 Tax=Nocardioides potassii TaxID=2911371 RepID=A0ABS9HDG7_9ACTN|nr:NUDIX hydrolase [Nocardioides potassii]MCF6378361.1 NUDIX hydrolase [Nocardioides potassii]
MDDPDARFPALAGETYVDYARARTRYVTGVAKHELVTRLHLVALTHDREVVVCRSAEGWRFLPGGTREEGEALTDLARRELLEEAGATLLGDLHHFSAHEVDSEREQPYRPHFPHPRSYWAYAVARVEITGEPLNPPDGEDVVEVLTLPVLEAADYLWVDDPIHAEVVLHAETLGLLA